MSKDNRPRSWKEMRDHRANQDSFIGRETQLKAFRDVLTIPFDQRSKVIFNISGQGGIGKTTLLKQLRKIATDLKQLIAYADEGVPSNRVDDVSETLDRLATDFEQQGQKFDKFRERYKTYRQKRQELEADPEAPQGVVAGLGRILTKASLGAAKSIPGSGAVLDLVETDAIADKAGEWMAFIARKVANKDEVQLLREPLAVLTPLFLEDLNRIAERQTVVLLLDTYEQTGVFLDDWLHSLLDGRFGELTPNFLIGIAGRDSLSRNTWAEMEEWIVRSELEPFTPNEAKQYLTDRGITNEAVIQEIWRLSSGGLPLLIGMMAQAVPTSADVLDPCEEAVERFLKWELDAAKRQLALNAALPRILNRDILALLVDVATVNEMFEWIKERSFILEHPEGWQYHNIVREQMLRYQRRVSPKEWAAQHTKLAEYYDGLRNGLELSDKQQQKNETWQNFTLEWLYHSLCAAPLQQMKTTLTGWLMALDSSKEFAQQWAEVIKIAGISTGSEDVKRWGQQLQNGLQGLEENHWEEMVEVLSALLQESWLEDKHRAIALVYQGLSPLLCFVSQNNSSQVQWRAKESLDLNQVLESLIQAVNLVPDNGEYLTFRGIIYMLKGSMDDAKADLTQALELNELDSKLKDVITTFLAVDFQNGIEYLRELYKDCKQFNLFKIDPLEITHKFEEEKQRLKAEIQRINKTRAEEKTQREKEVQRLNEETQRAKEETQKLKEKIDRGTDRRKKLAQELWKLVEEVYGQGEEIQNLREEVPAIKEACEKLTKFVSTRKEEIKRLEEEIQNTKKNPHRSEKKIHEMEEELCINKKELLKVVEKFKKFREEFQQKDYELQGLK